MTQPARPVWQLTRDGYQYARGVHRPFIAEVSALQLQRMSGRARRAYEERRRGEWDASAQCAADYAAEVCAAFDGGAFKLDDPALSPDARTVIVRRQLDADAARVKAAVQAAEEINRAAGLSAVVGDTVFDLFTRRYVAVVKAFKQSLRVTDGTREYKLNRGAAWWVSYDECKAAAEQGIAIGKETRAQLVPACAASMGCLCAAHARGVAAALPCNASEEG